MFNSVEVSSRVLRALRGRLLSVVFRVELGLSPTPAGSHLVFVVVVDGRHRSFARCYRWPGQQQNTEVAALLTIAEGSDPQKVGQTVNRKTEEP